MILFIRNISIEGPETLGTFFRQQGFPCQDIDLSQGQSLPENLADIQAVVCLGGPMNVYEEDQYPWLKEEDVFIKEVLAQRIPFLGICLGSQLLSKACGAKVVRSPQEEIGFSEIVLSEEGNTDTIFEGMESPCRVYQWHGDMFEVPEGGVLLASSSKCPHQAFRVGSHAYGFQFHIEITDQSIAEWCEAYWQKDEEAFEKRQAMIADYETGKEKFNKTALKVYNNFLLLIQKGRTRVENRLSAN